MIFNTELQCFNITQLEQSRQLQGPRRYFEIGGAPLVTRYWRGGEGTRHLFLLTLYNSKNIRGARAPRPPCSAVPELTQIPQRKSILRVAGSVTARVPAITTTGTTWNTHIWLTNKAADKLHEGVKERRTYCNCI